MPDDRKKKLWKLYRSAAQARAQGYSYQSINERIVNQTTEAFGKDGRVAGLASLEKELGIEAESAISTGNLLRSGFQGAAFGFGDELYGAAAAAIPGGHDYESARAEFNTRDERFEEAHPVASIGANMVGGAILPGAGGAGVVRGVTGNIGKKMIAGGAVGSLLGAGGGALEGAGRAEPGERMAGAAMGGAGGAAVGGTLGLLGPAAGPPARKLAGVATDRLRQGGARRIAGNELSGALEDANLTPDKFIERYAELPPGSLPADVDPGLADRARAAANLNPSLRREGGVVDDVVSRHTQRGERMASALRDESRLLPGFDIEEVSEAAKKHVRDMYYRPLERANQSVTSPQFRELFADPDMKRILRSRGINPGDDGAINFTQVQSILGRIQAKLKNQADPDLYRRYKRLQREFTSAVEDEIDDFRIANLAYTHAMERGRAHELGAKAVNQSAEVLRKAFDDMPTREAKEAFRQGFLDKVERSLRETETGGAMAGRILRAGPEMLDRLHLLFPDEEAMGRYLKTLEGERRWQTTYNALFGNSTTARQLSDMTRVSGLTPSKQQLLGEILTMAFDDRRTRLAAAEIVGETLLGQGEDAARRVAAAIAARGGAIAGARQAATAVSGGRAAAGLLGTGTEERQPEPPLY